jgi:DNA (cytosine-5)-methyltransferase 1
LTGGLDLAAEWAGFTTVGQCEWADYPTKVLEKHWPDVPRWRDIRSVTAESFREKTGLRTVTTISGGFPCQPFSVAGQRKGKNDDRYLWPEMLRVVEELQPSWVVGENVTGIVTMALDQVLSDLENINYAGQAIIIPAASVGAIHLRERVFIFAHSNEMECKKTVLDNSSKIIQRSKNKGKRSPNRFGIALDNSIDITTETSETIQRNIESYVLRIDDGVSSELDENRLGCLGNAVVPQQAYPIFQAIADIERGVT